MTTDYEQEIRRNYRWNFAIIAGVDSCWGFGGAFASYAAILPVFLKQLGASNFVIGLLPAVFMFSLTTPQLLVARLTRHMPVKKFFFTLTHYPGCLGLLPLSYLVFCLGGTHNRALVAATLVWLALFGLSISFAMPMWVNLMAKLFPPAVRGKSFGYVFVLYSTCGSIGSMCAAQVLDRFEFPTSFALLFLVGGVVLSGCVTSFFWLREPPKQPDRAERGGRFWRDVVDILREGGSFRWLLVARAVGAFCLMGTAFYTVAGVEKFDLTVGAAGRYGAVLLGAQVAGSLIAGWLGDRLGFKLVAVLAPAFDLAAAALAILAPSPSWYHLVMILWGLRRSFAMVGMHNLSIEFCPTFDKTTFIALGSTAMCPAYIIGPVIGGLLAEHHPAGYTAVFVSTVVCGLAAFLLMVFCVQEPRRRREGGA